AGRELSKKDVVASIQWKSVYRAFTDDLSDGGVLCLEHRRCCVHDYGLHRLARRQREIDHYSLLHIDRNVLLLDLLEALCFCGYRVTSNLDRRKNIFASGAASGRHGESRIFIGNGQIGRASCRERVNVSVRATGVNIQRGSTRQHST